MLGPNFFLVFKTVQQMAVVLCLSRFFPPKRGPEIEFCFFLFLFIIEDRKITGLVLMHHILDT